MSLNCQRTSMSDSIQTYIINRLTDTLSRDYIFQNSNKVYILLTLKCILTCKPCSTARASIAITGGFPVHGIDPLPLQLPAASFIFKLRLQNKRSTKSSLSMQEYDKNPKMQ